MATNGEAEAHVTGVIGNKKNFWLYDSRTGFDLTHPESPDAPKIVPRVQIETTTEPIAVDPEKTALVIIDMQNCKCIKSSSAPNQVMAGTIAKSYFD